MYPQVDLDQQDTIVAWDKMALQPQIRLVFKMRRVMSLEGVEARHDDVSSTKAGCNELHDSQQRLQILTRKDT